MHAKGFSHFQFPTHAIVIPSVNSIVTGSSIMLLWATPYSLDDEVIASYIISLSGVQDTADAITYTLPGSRQSAVLGGLHPGVTYQVQLMTETSSGLQPFYSANVTTLLEDVSESVKSGVGGAGVMLAIVLVAGVVLVLGVVCCIVWRRRSRKVETDERYVIWMHAKMLKGDQSNVDTCNLVYSPSDTA